MSEKNSSSGLLLFLSVFVLFSLSPAWSADEEALGRQAEQEGKLGQAVTHYVAALQSASEGSSRDQQLREQIIKLVQKSQPPPALPEEALRHMGRGQAAVEIAEAPEDYKRAIVEFEKAVRLAPWLASGYYNLSVVQEKAGRFTEAIRSSKLYLAAAPRASDAQEVRTRIYRLEYKAERQREEQRAKEVKLREEQEKREGARRIIASLSRGTWCDNGQFEVLGTRCASGAPGMGSVLIDVHGNEMEINIDWHNRSFTKYNGTIDGLKLTGTVSWAHLDPERPNCPNFNKFEGSISADGKIIAITKKKILGFRGCTVTKWGPAETVRFIRIR